MSKKVILDVDTGVDDAIGILLALKSRQMDVLGITTVNGNVSLEAATVNTCKIVELVGVDVPVIMGASSPLIRTPYFEHRIHGEDGIGGALKDMNPQKKPDEGFGPDFIINSILSFPGEVTLVMTAPLTNLALAVKKCPEITRFVKEVIFMGGVVKDFGNVTPTAEYNMYTDPEAAKIVFHAGFPSLTLVGLDVTRKVLLTEEHMDAIQNPVLASYIKESTKDYRQRYFERNHIHGAVMHDPLAVAVAIDTNIVSKKKYYVDVETSSELCDGQTVCDFQNRLGKPANLDVCLEVDDKAFITLFHEVINS
ncbi:MULTISPECIES: nucleoside hydrolase [Bacillaceae]|uniref:Purine nucleosidase n=1 Tax=Peribacillus huizhouensis TaxID=1501239 RepID=A0ABR6CL80_9BACI|nr:MULTISPECIES: nucleoside hydrolase [Bacillaceae]MBA9025122.1 purine nucleosidase [Peribacillus huizhouensis]